RDLPSLAGLAEVGRLEGIELCIVVVHARAPEKLAGRDHVPRPHCLPREALVSVADVAQHRVPLVPVTTSLDDLPHVGPLQAIAEHAPFARPHDVRDHLLRHDYSSIYPTLAGPFSW